MHSKLTHSSSSKNTLSNSLARYLLRCVLIFCLSINYSAASTQLQQINQSDLLQRINEKSTEKDKQLVIIDVRTAKEFADGHIPNAINLPHRSLLKDTSLLSQYQGKEIVFYCHSGVRVGKVSKEIYRHKSIHSENLYHLTGDYRAWRARALPIATPPKK